LAAVAATASTAVGVLSAVRCRQKLAKLWPNRATLHWHVHTLTMQALGDGVDGLDMSEFDANNDSEELSAAEEPSFDVEGADEPTKKRSAQVIQLRLRNQQQYQDVLRLVERYLPKFDITNMVHAMSSCSRAVRHNRNLKRQIQFDNAFISLFCALKKRLLSRTVNSPPSLLTDLLGACACLGIFDAELFNEVVADATQRMAIYSDTDIAYMVLALGYLRQKPKATFMQALVREMRARLDRRIDCRNLSRIVTGMMLLGIRDDRLMKTVSEHLLGADLNFCVEHDLVRLASGFSSLSYLDEKTFGALGRRIVASIEALSTKQLSNACRAYAGVALGLPESHFVMESLLHGMELQQHDLSNEELVIVAVAAANFQKVTEDPIDDTGIGRQGPNWIQRRLYQTRGGASTTAQMIVEQMELRSLESFSTRHLILLVTSLMRLRLRDEDVLSDAASLLAENAAELRMREICEALSAYAHLDFVHIPFVNAMLGEVHRRGLLQQMNTTAVAVLAYSLARCRILDEQIMGQIAAIACSQRREFSAQQLTMVMWSMATLCVKENTEVLANACMEDICKRSTHYHKLSIATCCWAFAIISSGGCALWAIGVLLSDGFGAQNFTPIEFSMVYHLCISMRVDHGLAMHELAGWQMARRWYDETSSCDISMQCRRLASRLRIQGILHVANCIVPRLEGFPEAGVQADIILERLKLIIEVDGTAKMAIPLNKTLMEQTSIDLHGISGKPYEVIRHVRQIAECGMIGAAAWKRRLLRKGGWRIVTLSSDENEEYMTSALSKVMQGMDDVNSIGSDEVGQQQRQEQRQQRQQQQQEQEQVQEELEAEEKQEPKEGDGWLDQQDTAVNVGFDAWEQQSPYERRLRKEYARAMDKFQRRILKESGNAAARYTDHLAFRRWQMGVEEQVFQEMLAAL